MAEQKTVLRILRLMRKLRSQPMNIQQMLNYLEPDGVTTKRTIHRYLSLFEELNLNLQKDDNYRYRIADKNLNRDFALDDLLPEELDFIKTILENHAPNHPNTEGVLQKLLASNDLTSITDSMLRQQTERNIEQLKKAIQQNVCVTLKRYYTLDTGKVADRHVEPKELHKGGKQAYCYDPKDGKMKKYSTDRIEAVELLPHPQKHDKEFENSDIFGFNHVEARGVKLRLSSRAYHILREEYPRSEKYVKTEGDKYLFEHIYCKPEGISRFLLSVGSIDAEVIYPKDLIEYLNARLLTFGK